MCHFQTPVVTPRLLQAFADRPTLQPMSKDRTDHTPAPASGTSPEASSRAEIDLFLDRVRSLSSVAPATHRGRLIFALDATMSRQPTWDTACRLQADMFREAASIGGLDIQLVYYRGLAECRASPWVAEAGRLRELMSGIDCRSGQTQIGKVLAHARRENDARKIAVLVFIGDAMEESLDDLCAAAGELGLRNVRAFMFQEGQDPVCEQAFREVARLTHGAFCHFSSGAAHELAELLRAAAAYAAGGIKALANLKERQQSAAAVKLIEQLK